ncbi:hypothetical protein BDV32DRAFT_87021 [Aspergillus pseudonomiae]|nr:hypothetical protein BDV32DRAFT_87021 [Aspergillus pseudonomiae]
MIQRSFMSLSPQGLLLFVPFSFLSCWCSIFIVDVFSPVILVVANPVNHSGSA